MNANIVSYQLEQVSRINFNFNVVFTAWPKRGYFLGTSGNIFQLGLFQVFFNAKKLFLSISLILQLQSDFFFHSFLQNVLKQVNCLLKQFVYFSSVKEITAKL